MAQRNLSSISIHGSDCMDDYSSSTPYQVDFAAVNGGKRFKASKRFAKWIVGFSNENAISAGKSGADCRGKEHEVVMSISLTSGRNCILIDGEVVLDIPDHSPKIEFRDYLEGRPVDIVAYKSDSVRPQGAREFDLLVDGKSFFSLPRVFELGSLRNDKVIRKTRKKRKKKVTSGDSSTRRSTIDA